MDNKDLGGAPASGTGFYPSDHAPAGHGAPRFNPSRKSVSQRLNPRFKFVFQQDEDCGTLQVSGPIETMDQLDAVVAALSVMRAWFAPCRDTDGSPEGRDAQQLDGEAATAGAEGIAEEPGHDQ